MANKQSKGRQKVSLVKARVSPSGPKQTFARPSIKKTAQKQEKENLKKSSSTLPLSVVVVPFHESVFTPALIDFVSQLVVTDSDTHRGVQIRTGCVPGQPKRRVQLTVPNHRDNMALILDAAKTADVLLCVFPNEATFEQSCFDATGYETLKALRMQGLPPQVMGTVMHPPADAKSKQSIKTVERYFVSEFATDRAEFVMPSANVKVMDGLARQVAVAFPITAPSNQLALRRQRGYMLIDELVVADNQEAVQIKGFARGQGFGLKSVVHLTGSPLNFIVKEFEVLDGGNEEMTSFARHSDEEIERMREDLQPLRPAEEQDQTWPTPEEEAQAMEDLLQRRMKRVSVPLGADSEMEAAWLGEDLGEEFVDEEELERGMFDWNILGDAHDNLEMGEEKKPERFEHRSREDMDFVDEVDTPETMTARVRFQKYRGLKSLRSGNWDPYEELPVEYSQIHEFQDMGWATKQSMTHLEETGKEGKGKYIRLVLVPTVSGSLIDERVSSALVASTIAPFETKVTVVHCRVARLSESSEIEIKNKELMTVQVGLRRFEVRPTFSEIPKYSSSTGTAPLQKMLRSVPSDAVNVLMSFYAPAVFGTASSVLGFVGNQLTMWGSLQGCHPNKPVVVKRSTLTGYPFRVHQTKAVCRFMFFNPTDIDWFKPVELSTKKGLRGHIIESLGTHGYMKCRFNGQLTSDDIICLHLYKRVFPKFHPRAWQ